MGCPGAPQHPASWFKAAFLCVIHGRVWHLAERRVTKSTLGASASLPEAWHCPPRSGGFSHPWCLAFPTPLPCPTASPTVSASSLSPQGEAGGFATPCHGDTPVAEPPPLSPPPALAPPLALIYLCCLPAESSPSAPGLSPPLKAAASLIAHRLPSTGPGPGGRWQLHGVGGSGRCPRWWAALPYPRPPLPLAAAHGRCKPATNPRTGG